ncbi:MAG: ABC transporter permease [Bacteroidetes bacterium]|nr:ABC transporter permease [Bacteroidota bacterium]
MIYNYVRTALRYFKTHQTYTAVNLLGLTLGFACFLLLNFYVSSEKNFDRQHGHVYRLLQDTKDGQGKTLTTAKCAPRTGTGAKEQFSEIEAVTQLLVMGRMTVGNDPGNRNYEQITTIDPSFFEVFDFQLVEGTPEQVFSQPNALLLTRKLKERYFGTLPAAGKVLKTNTFEGVVAGVLEDFPANTHLHTDLMMPTQTAAANLNFWKDFVATTWDQNAMITYMKLRPETNLTTLGDKITQLTKSNWPAKQEPFSTQFHLQPVEDIHLEEANVDGGVNWMPGNAFYVRIFFWVALVILLVACFNYTGLLNVSYLERSREIGVRKAIGAARSSLLFQFLVESMLLTGTSLLLEMALLSAMQPVLTQWLGKPFDWSALPANRIGMLLGTGLLLSLSAIVYPAIVSSRLTTLAAMTQDKKSGAGMPLRRSLTVFQFAVSICLLACTLVFYRQVQFLQSKDRGFDLEGLLVVDINSRTLRNSFEAIKHEFSQLPEVKSVCVSSRVPGEWKDLPMVGVYAEGQQDKSGPDMIYLGADQDFLNTYGVKLLEGSNFSGMPTDTSRVLINRLAAAQLGLSDPVGQWIEIPYVNWTGEYERFDRPVRVQIAGVIDNFQVEDFRQTLKPLVLGCWNNSIQNIDYYTLRISSSNWAQTLATLRSINDRFDPQNPIEYNFLNEQFGRFVEADIQRSNLLIFFSAVVVFISCLGLFAMAAFVLRRRTKEIGIRKVLGAGVAGIAGMITADFARLVLLGSVIALPLAWLLMNRWLQEFAFRIPLKGWMFAAAGLATLLVAVLTVGYQSVRAALANPVKSLRSE